MKFRKSLAVVAVAALALGACQSGGGKQTAGGLGGAVLGGLAGAQFGSGSGRLVATGAGVLLGALLGSEIGSSLDKADRLYLEDTTQNTLETAPSGRPITWKNPDSGNYGTVTARPSYQASSGEYCREYSQTIYVGGKQEDAFGKACRQPDGSWKVVN
jgi:surface antigen